MVATLIPMTAHYPQQCEETLSLALTLFKKLAETSLEFISLDDVMRQWGSLLLSHNSKEVAISTPCLRIKLISFQNVGHPESIDMVAQGLAKLCHTAASFAKASQQPLTCRYTIFYLIVPSLINDNLLVRSEPICFGSTFSPTFHSIILMTMIASLYRGYPC